MWNRKYVKLQGVKNTGATRVPSPGSCGFVIIMEEQPPGNLWALPTMSVPSGCFTQSLWDSYCKKTWQRGDGCAQAPSRPHSGLIRRCARDPCRNNKPVWFESGLRACRKKHCSCISKTNLHVHRRVVNRQMIWGHLLQPKHTSIWCIYILPTGGKWC